VWEPAYCTVRTNVVVCWSVPAVAVTVIVFVTGGGGELDAELHPTSRLSAKAAISSVVRKPRRRPADPKQQNASSSAATGSRLPCAALVAIVDSVSVVVATPPEGVTVLGWKLQLVPEGSPEHANETCEENPFCGVIETVTLPGDPVEIVMDEGEALTEKSTGRR
jgi:hypothetical protein